MAYNVELHWYASVSDSEPTYSFKLANAMAFDEDYSQESINLPFPYRKDEYNAIFNLFGQKREIKIDSLLMDRDDDYTMGTGGSEGFPLTGSANEQRIWLLDFLFNPRGFHMMCGFVDLTYNDVYINGRIENIQTKKSGDDPVKWDLVFKFVRGQVAAAGQWKI